MTRKKLDRTSFIEPRLPPPRIQRIPVEAIVCDTKLQIREKLHAPTITKYRTAYQNDAPLPPIRVIPAGASFVLIDGWHRLAAFKQLYDPARSWIEAEVFAADPKAAPWLAAQANLTHGLPLKKKETRRVFRAYVKAGQHRRGIGFKSYREMATELGGLVSYGTVRLWMLKDFPRIARAISGAEGGNLKPVAAGPRGYGVDPVELAQDHLRQARAAFEAATDLDARAIILQRVEATVREMKATDPAAAEHDPWEGTQF